MPVTRTLKHSPHLADVVRARIEFEAAYGSADLLYHGKVYDSVNKEPYEFRWALPISRLYPQQLKLAVPLLDGFFAWMVTPIEPYSFDIVARDGRAPARSKVEEEKLWPEWTARLRPYAQASKLADIDAILHSLSFRRPVSAPTEGSITAAFRSKTRRCGVYVLHFTDGEHYVGQTVDITRRFVQHRKRHGDIARVSFRPVGRRSLDFHEAQLIRLLELRQLRLRNIDMTSILASEPGSFDELMPADQQQRWLSDVALEDMAGERVEVTGSDALYSQRYRQLQGLECYDALFPVVRDYVRKALPAVRRGEASYWQASVLPANGQVLVRVNVNWQEVFFANIDEQGLFFYFVLSRRELQRAFGDDLALFDRRFPDAEWEDSSYRSGGSDQVSVMLWDAATALRFVNDPAVLPALRHYNLRLMKKGKSPWARKHNFDLITDILREGGTS